MMARVAGGLIALACAGPLPAQRVEALWSQAEDLRRNPGADPAAVRTAYARVVQAFDALAVDDAARRHEAGFAAHGALLAGDAARALTLAQQRERATADDALAIETRMRALVELGQADAFVAAMASAARANGPAVEKACVALVEHHGGALCEAADRALRQGHADEGMAVFEALVRASGRAPVALANLALANRHLGRLEASEGLYREALQALPEDPDFWNDYGLLLKGQRRDREAMVAFAKSHAHDPTRPPTGPAVSNLAFMQGRGRGRGAEAEGLAAPVAALTDVVARRPDAMMARRLLIDALVDPTRAPGRPPGGVPPRVPDSVPDRSRAGR